MIAVGEAHPRRFVDESNHTTDSLGADKYSEGDIVFVV